MAIWSEPKKPTGKTPMGPTTDIDSQHASFVNLGPVVQN